jgi:hypothetical protein
MKHLTYTSKDKLRSVVVRERIGRDASETPYIHMSLARPVAESMGVADIKDLPPEKWSQFIETATYIQQVIALEGEWGDIRLPASDSDEDRHVFYCNLLDEAERYILTLQEAIKEVNASPLNPP